MRTRTVYMYELMEAGFDFGLQNYPIWSEDHRSELNEKILNHYKYYQIGFETPGRFKDELNIKMNEIMPYFIEIYKTTLYEYNHLDTANYTEEYTIERDTTGNTTNKEVGTSQGSGTVTGESNSNSTTKSKNIDIDTPQSALGELDNSNIDVDSSFNYASNVNLNKNEGQASSNDSSTTTTESNLTTDFESDSTKKEIEKYTRHLKGDYGVRSVQSVIQEQRNITIDVDMKIVAKLGDLFLKVW